MYSVRFKLDVKKNVYVSKKAANREPYYQINAIIRVNGNKEINYFTGYCAQRSTWFKNAAEANKGDKGRTCGIHKGCNAKKRSRIVPYSEANRVLDLIQATIVTLEDERRHLTKEELIALLDEKIGKTKSAKAIEVIDEQENPQQENQFWILAELFCQDLQISKGRRRTRYNAMQHLKAFERQRKMEITYAACNAKLLTDFHIYLQQDEGKQHYTNGGQSWKTRKKNGNTISKILTATKHFFRWSRLQYGITEYGNISDYTVPTAKYGDPVTITQDEKRQLWQFVTDDPKLELVRDLFYFQCSIGARISDFFNLKYQNLTEEDGRLVVRYRPKKTQHVTAADCRIPLSDKAVAILKKYKADDATSQTPLFPFPKYKQDYNDTLKRIFRRAGLDRMVMVPTIDGETEMKPLYELAKSKFARSSFIDTLVSQEVSDNIIVTMSGHTPGSKAFHRYHNSEKYKQQYAAVALLD